MSSLKIVDTGVQTAEKNMEIDSALLEKLEGEQKPILHLYDWEGECATYGHFIEPADYLNLEMATELKLSLARRPTGGGIVFHICDLAFSFLLPSAHEAFSLNTLENYALVNQIVIETVGPWIANIVVEQLPAPTLLPQDPVPLDRAAQHFCMAKPTKYDVMIGMQKIGGAAQRRTRAGFLHQGTISLAALPEEYLTQVLLPHTQVLGAMKQYTFSMLPSRWTHNDLLELRHALKERLAHAFSGHF
jgi:lipoate-protein ligase A